MKIRSILTPKRSIAVAFCLALALLALMAGSISPEVAWAEQPAGPTAPAGNKSLYVISDMQGPAQTSYIRAYGIQSSPPYLTQQFQQTVDDPTGMGAVGLAIDSDAAKLFVTFESSNQIRVVDARTMDDLGLTTAPGSSDLAGIAYDHEKVLLYVVDRDTSNLYVYDWDAANNVLTNTVTSGNFLTLEGCANAFGLAFDEDEDLLYVSDASTTIHYYDTTNIPTSGIFTRTGTVTGTIAAIGIAVDFSDYLYYGAGFTGDYYLERYDLTSTAKISVQVATDYGVVGVAVDQDTGLVYITTGEQSHGGDDYIRVYSTTLTLVATDTLNSDGSASGICVPIKDVGYAAIQFDKEDDKADGEYVGTGDKITYTISYDNSGNTSDVHNVVITDTLSPHVSYVSSVGGTYNAGAHEVVWNIGYLTTTLPAAKGAVTLTVRVSLTADSSIVNTATLYSDETGTTVQNEDTPLDSDGDGIPNTDEGLGDRDGDGIPDYTDYDPTGYFYDRADGKIVSGGLITVNGPGVITITHDGSNGYYWFTTDGTAGTYTIIPTLPAGCVLDTSCPQQDPPPFDPTGLQSPVVLGNGEIASTGYLTSGECTTYYLTLDLAAADPVIINNNIPLLCPVPVGGHTETVETPVLLQPWLLLAAVVSTAAIAALALKRRTA